MDDISVNNISRFKQLGSSEIEKVVKTIFNNLGYEFVKNNYYDRQGGDADLIFTDNSLSEFYEVSENGTEVNSEVYVQVKNKEGIDSNDIEGVKQLIKITENIPYSTKILISTVDKFTDKCIDFANQNNVLLIDGKGFMKLILHYGYTF